MELKRDGPERIVGRYALCAEIASGGMATVHLGRLIGQVGFSRTVAIKRLHPHVAKDPESAATFLDEARLAARIQHPNVVSTLDVVAADGELFLVMEYVHGESLAGLLRRLGRRNDRMPTPVVSSILCGALHGLHSAHEAKNEQGGSLGLVHRDVSPQNIMVGLDGVARVLDFGVAKAIGRSQTTRDGQIKGKLCYMAPEQLRSGKVDRRVDVYAAGVVLWEALTGRRLFDGDNEGMVIASVLAGAREAPSTYAPELPGRVDGIVMRALAVEPDDRWASARELAVALEEALGVASPRHVGEWVEQLAGSALASRAKQIEEIESGASVIAPSTGGALPGGESGMSPPSERLGSSVQLSSISVSGPRVAEPLARRGHRRVAAGALVLLALAAVPVVLALRAVSTPSAVGRGDDDNGVDQAQRSRFLDPSTPASQPATEVAESSAPIAPTATVTAAASVSALDAGQPAGVRPRVPPVAKPRSTTSTTGTQPAVKFTQPD